MILAVKHDSMMKYIFIILFFWLITLEWNFEITNQKPEVSKIFWFSKKKQRAYVFFKYKRDTANLSQKN